MFTATCVSDSDSAKETFKFHFKSFQSHIKNTAELKLLVICFQHTKIYVLKIDCNVSRGWVFSRFSLAFSVFLVNVQRNLSKYSKHDWKYFKHTWYESMQMNYFPHLLLRFTLIHCVTHFLATFQCNAKITAKKNPQKPQLFTVSTQSTTLYNGIIHRWIQSDFQSYYCNSSCAILSTRFYLAHCMDCCFMAFYYTFFLFFF